MGEVPQRRLRNGGLNHNCAKEVDVPGVYLYGKRGHLQAAASRVGHLHGGMCYFAAFSNGGEACELLVIRLPGYISKAVKEQDLTINN